MMKFANLHEHLGSSVSIKTLYEIAKKHGVKLKYDFDKFHDIVSGKNDKIQIEHEKYLDKFVLTEKIQSSPLAIEESMFDTISNAYVNQNVDLLEIRFNPFYRNAKSEYDVDTIIEFAISGLKKATSIYPIKAGIIICSDRRFTGDMTSNLAQKCCKYHGHGVVGFDIAGPYIDKFKIEDHVDGLCKILDHGGLGLTMHSSESVDNSDELLFLFHKFGILPHRIGHGIKMAQNNKLLWILRKNNVLLEVCPTSNMKTSSVKTLKELEETIMIFQNMNINYCFNTDGSVFLNTTIEKEYDLMNNVVFGKEKQIAMENSRKFSFIK